MANYSELVLTEIDAESPWQEPTTEQIRDNFINHESRIKTLEDPGSRIYSTFARRGGYGFTPNTWNDEVVRGLATTYVQDASLEGGQFYVGVYETGTFVQQMIGSSGTADEHFLRLCGGGTSGGGVRKAMLFAQLSNRYDRRVAPVTYEIQARVQDKQDIQYFGLLRWGNNESPNVAIAQPSWGIFSEFVSGSNWRFAATDGGAPTNGANFTAPPNGSWFKIKVEFRGAAASEEVECWIDYLGGAGYESKALFTASDHIPIARSVFGGVITQDSETDVDWLLTAAGGPIAPLT